MKYLILLLLSFNAFADTATFTYTPPVERTDATPLPAAEIGGYNVFVNGVYVEAINPLTAKPLNPLPADATGFILDLQSGEYSVTVTAFDVESRESTMSAPVAVGIPYSPVAPTNLQVVVTVNVVIQ